MKAKPLWFIPSTIKSASFCGSAEKPRATKVAPEASASSIGFSACSGLPWGVESVTNPVPLVGDVWPLVRPYVALSITT